MQLILPTRRRDELPQGFAYPLWPTAITEALRNTPQFNDMEIEFRLRDEFWESHWRKRIDSDGDITLMRAEYKHIHSPYFPAWKITLVAVPEHHLEEARTHLVNSGLPELRAKLKALPAIPSGSIREEFHYHLQTDELQPVAETIAVA